MFQQFCDEFQITSFFSAYKAKSEGKDEIFRRDPSTRITVILCNRVLRITSTSDLCTLYLYN